MNPLTEPFVSLAAVSGSSGGLSLSWLLLFLLTAIVLIWLIRWLLFGGEEETKVSGRPGSRSATQATETPGAPSPSLAPADGKALGTPASPSATADDQALGTPSPSLAADDLEQEQESVLVREKDKENHQEKTSAAAPTPPETAPDDFQAATADEAAGLFAAELEAGEVEQDSVYGIVYRTKPDQVDDLKRIKGVGKVLEGKLNEVGVYRFKQVAVWTDSACAEFSQMLTSFKDRLYRDNWLTQAKDLHEEKTGEKL